MTQKRSEEVEKLSVHLDYLFNYGVDFKQRVIRLNPEKTDDDDSYQLRMEHFSLLDSAMSELESYGRSTITIKISSIGGDIIAARAIVGRLKASKCKIVTEGYGTIASAATLILACGDERKISEYATFMHHETQAGFEGGLARIKADVIQTEREDLLWAKWMSEFSLKSEEFYMKNGAHVDVYWTPEQLLEFGIVDKII